MLRFIIIYFLLINIVNFVTFWIDKNLARNDKNRISEHTLILLSALGGATGGLAAMYTFRHKTKKAKFFLTLPFLMILHIAIGILIVF